MTRLHFDDKLNPAFDLARYDGGYEAPTSALIPLGASGCRCAMIGADGGGYERARRTPSRRDPRRRCGGLLAADGSGRGRDARTPEGASVRARRSEDHRAPWP